MNRTVGTYGRRTVMLGWHFGYNTYRYSKTGNVEWRTDQLIACGYWCSGKLIGITYSECIPRAITMCIIAVCSLRDILFHIISQRERFSKKIEHKICDLILPKILISNIYRCKNDWTRYCSCKVPLLLLYCYYSGIYGQILEKILSNKFNENPSSWIYLSMQQGGLTNRRRDVKTDRQTDRYKEANSSLS